MKLNKCRAAIAAIGFGLGLAATPVGAAISWFLPVTTFEDDNLDYVVDSGAGNVGTVGVGDRLVSVLEFNQTTGVNPGQGPNSVLPLELTGVADMTVVNILAGGILVLLPSNTLIAQGLNGGQAGILGGFAAGTAVALWTDPTPDLNVINAACGTRANCAALAGLGGTDGSALFMTVGFFGDPDAVWLSNPTAAGSIIASVEAGNATTQFASFSYSLQIGVNNTGKLFDQQPCAPICGPGGDGLIDVVGAGSVLGGQNLNHTEWTGRSDTDAQVVPIPEPGSLALLAGALLGLGFGMRKRNT